MAKNEDLLYQAAVNDPDVNLYDWAFIFKDLFLSVVPPIFAGLASVAVVFVPLSEFQQGALVALNAPAGYYTFKRNSPLEKIVTDKR